MPTQNNSNSADERLTLTVGGISHSDWLRVSVRADFLTPAGAWEVTVGLDAARLPSEVREGARAVLHAGNDVLMTGLIDDITHAVMRGQHLLTLTGRDNAAVLLDCSAPIFTEQELTLDEVMSKVVRPLGITSIAVHADNGTAPQKFVVTPFETAWDALKKVAEVSGLWPWVAPDGTLIIGDPDYSTEPVASLAMNRADTGNLLYLTKHSSIAGRFSEVTVVSATDIRL